MEQQTQQKDWWKISKKNFFALGVLAIMAGIGGAVPIFWGGGNIIAAIIMFVLAFIFRTISKQLEQHNTTALYAGYVFGALIALGGINSFLAGAVLQALIGLIAGGYILYSLYLAHTQHIPEAEHANTSQEKTASENTQEER